MIDSRNFLWFFFKTTWLSELPVCNSENKAKWCEKSQISETYTECLIVSKYVPMYGTNLTYYLEMDTKFLTNQIVFDKK